MFIADQKRQAVQVHSLRHLQQGVPFASHSN